MGGASIPEDVARVEASLNIVQSGQHLAVDANAGFNRERALAYAKALAPFKLKWFEEPADPLGYEVLTEFIAHYGAAVGTGENLFSTSCLTGQALGLKRRINCIRRCVHWFREHE